MYRVILPKRVERQLDKLPADDHGPVMQGLLGLTGDPRPPGVRKLFGYERTYCAHLPNRYRLYYDIDEDKQVILVLAVARSRLGRKWELEVDD